jgi:hypothetical protein
MNARVGSNLNAAAIPGLEERFLVQMYPIVELNSPSAISRKEHHAIADEHVFSETNIGVIQSDRR